MYRKACVARGGFDSLVCRCKTLAYANVGQYHRLIDSSPPFWLNRNCRLCLGEISIA